MQCKQIYVSESRKLKIAAKKTYDLASINRNKKYRLVYLPQVTAAIVTFNLHQRRGVVNLIKCVTCLYSVSPPLGAVHQISHDLCVGGFKGF